LVTDRSVQSELRASQSSPDVRFGIDGRFFPRNRLQPRDDQDPDRQNILAVPPPVLSCGESAIGNDKALAIFTSTCKAIALAASTSPRIITFKSRRSTRIPAERPGESFAIGM